MATHVSVTCDRCGDLAPPEVVIAMVEPGEHMSAGWLRVKTERSTPPRGTSGENLVYCPTCAVEVMSALHQKTKRPCPKCGEEAAATPAFIDLITSTIKRSIKCPKCGKVVEEVGD